MRRFFSTSPYWPGGILAAVRIITGLLMIYHGYEVFDDEKMKVYFGWDVFQKLPAPVLMIFIGKIVELVAGILLVIGLFTRIGALLLLFVMIYITFFIGHGKFWYEDQHPFLFILLSLIFLFIGGGRFSLDHILFSSKSIYK